MPANNATSRTSAKPPAKKVVLLHEANGEVILYEVKFTCIKNNIHYCSGIIEPIPSPWTLKQDIITSHRYPVILCMSLVDLLMVSAD